MQVKAAVAREKGKIEIETLELAPPKAGEVLVKLVATGICHTDSAVIENFLPVTYPIVPGHEGAGIIEEVGPGVRGLAPGDRVILSYPSCGVCDHCLEGHPYACEDNFTLFFGGNYADGTKRLTTSDGLEAGIMFGQGSFSTYVVADQRNTIKVDIDNDEELAQLCSLGCGIQTGAGAVLNAIKPRPGSSIAVFGMGAVGLAGIMAAKIAGCSPIIAVHSRRGRDLALEFGATHVIDGRNEDVEARIKEITKGKGVNGALEAAGQASIVPIMLNSMAKEGIAILVSVTGPIQIPITLEPQIMNPSVTLQGAVEGFANSKVFIPELVQFYKEGRLPVDRLNTEYKFDDIKEAFVDLHEGKTVKSILKF
jgi:aryl-alcohol dehydrogenase